MYFLVDKIKYRKAQEIIEALNNGTIEKSDPTVRPVLEDELNWREEIKEILAELRPLLKVLAPSTYVAPLSTEFSVGDDRGSFNFSYSYLNDVEPSELKSLNYGFGRSHDISEYIDKTHKETGTPLDFYNDQKVLDELVKLVTGIRPYFLIEAEKKPHTNIDLISIKQLIQLNNVISLVTLITSEEGDSKKVIGVNKYKAEEALNWGLDELNSAFENKNVMFILADKSLNSTSLRDLSNVIESYVATLNRLFVEEASKSYEPGEESGLELRKVNPTKYLDKLNISSDSFGLNEEPVLINTSNVGLLFNRSKYKFNQAYCNPETGELYYGKNSLTLPITPIKISRVTGDTDGQIMHAINTARIAHYKFSNPTSKYPDDSLNGKRLATLSITPEGGVVIKKFNFSQEDIDLVLPSKGIGAVLLLVNKMPNRPYQYLKPEFVDSIVSYNKSSEAQYSSIIKSPNGTAMVNITPNNDYNSSEVCKMLKHSSSRALKEGYTSLMLEVPNAGINTLADLNNRNDVKILLDMYIDTDEAYHLTLLKLLPFGEPYTTLREMCYYAEEKVNLK